MWSDKRREREGEERGKEDRKGRKGGWKFRIKGEIKENEMIKKRRLKKKNKKRENKDT